MLIATAIVIPNNRIMQKRLKCALAILLISAAFFQSCSKQLDDKSEVVAYVNKNIDGLRSFCRSVEDTSPYFESITHTNNHPISESDAAEIVDGMYAVGRINDSLFYEEVSYDFIEKPLSEGIIDTVTMYVDYTLSYGFACNDDIGFYYTQTDKPLFCGKEYDFEKSDNGYEYALANGKVYYTERICENWFFYQMQ